MSSDEDEKIEKRLFCEVTRQFHLLTPCIDDLKLSSLLTAFEAVNRFLDCLGIGPLFFVQKDIDTKICDIRRIIDQAKPSEKVHYDGLLSTFTFECSKRIALEKTSVIWNLVRLKRGLIFINSFLSGLNDPNQSLSRACDLAYKDAFGTLHPKYVQALVCKLVLVLPSRTFMMERFALGTDEEAQSLILAAVTAITPVLEIIKAIFIQFEMDHLQ